jgi:protein-L-isoaspartate(D-aspartate) O-methyltransferase
MLLRLASLGSLAAVGLLACTRPAPVKDAATAATALQGAPTVVPPGSQTAAAEPEEARLRRHELVDALQRRDPSLDANVLAVMRDMPRHQFAPGLSPWAAYLDRPQPIGHGQTISQPYIVALMTTALQLVPDHKVLEIGTGSGYQAAILARLCKTVHTIEIVPPLGTAAAERLRAMGFGNVHVRIGDGYLGWPEQAPFDRILLTASPPELPPRLVQQLADGGVIVGPVGDVEAGPQVLGRWTKHGARLDFADLGPVLFVPMVKAKE